MNRVQAALFVVGLFCLVEGVWGAVAPYGAKKIAGWFVKVSGPRSVGLGILLLAGAAVLAVLVLTGQPLANWALLAVAAVLAALGFLSFRPDAVRRWLTVWILNRAPLTVRLIYLAEALVAVLLLWIALAGGRPR